VSRFSPDDADVYVFAGAIVNCSKTETTRGGKKIVVTPKEFKTFRVLGKEPPTRVLAG
jgi:DNA-binding response OmpR family regulator